MEQVVEVARVLREAHDFRGYIHLKTIPDASPELMQRAGRYADRLSINIELPTAESLTPWRPRKQRAPSTVHGPQLANRARRARSKPQAIVSNAAIAHHAGQRAAVLRWRAKHADDRGGPMRRTTALSTATSARLYGTHRLRRCTSAFSPSRRRAPCRWPRRPRCASTGCTSGRLADALLRLHHDEIVPPLSGGHAGAGHGPKLAWALAHRERFPVNLNTAPRELLLRVARLWCADGEPSAGRPPRATPAACRPVRLHVPLRRCCVCGGGRLPPWRALRLLICCAPGAAARATQFVLSRAGTMQRNTITLSTPPTGRLSHRRTRPGASPRAPQADGLALPSDAAHDLFAPEPRPSPAERLRPMRPAARPPTQCACASSSSCTATRPLCADVPPALAHGARRRYGGKSSAARPAGRRPHAGPPWSRAVRRDMHKMHAFVRFRP